MVYGTQITIVMWVYKPTKITGGAHIVNNIYQWDFRDPKMEVTTIYIYNGSTKYFQDPGIPIDNI